MASSVDEFEPPKELVKRVIVEAVQPSMAACEKERGVSMTARLTVWILDQPGSSRMVTSTVIGGPDVETKGEMRLRFRRTSRPERVLFCLNSLYQDLDPSSGFSGFTTRGDILITDDQVAVRPGGWTGHYNLDKENPSHDPWRSF